MAVGTPTIDFSTFVLSLASTAMLNMGRMPDPTGGDMPADLKLARQNIDMLVMLREKTKGNLTPEEGVLLDRLLHDLRLAFVEESRGRHS